MAAHTPAPWRAAINHGGDAATGWILGPNDENVVEYGECGSHKADWANPADFALAIAAPDLQSALSASDLMLTALRHILVGAPGWNPEAEAHLLAQQAENRAALAKSRGA